MLDSKVSPKLLSIEKREMSLLFKTAIEKHRP